MRLALLLLLLYGQALAGSAQWDTDTPWYGDNSFVECSIIGIPARSPTQFYNVIQVNDAKNNPYPDDVWNPVDISHWVPPGAKAARLDGILLLSHNVEIQPVDTAEVTLSYRRAGETIDFTYASQTIDQYGGGSRSNGGAWVALDQYGRFEFKWTRLSQRAYHGFNVRMTAYCR